MAASERWIRVKFGGDSRALKAAADAGSKAVAAVSRAVGGLKPTADTAAKATDRLGDQMDDATRAAHRLDEQIEEATASLRALAVQQTLTGKNGDLIRQMKAQERQLRSLTRTRKQLGDVLKPDVGEAAEIGVGIGARIGPFIVQSLGRAVGAAGPAVAIGAPIVAGVASYLGSAAAGAILAGAAVGAVAGGVALAARDSRVTTSARALGMQVSDQLASAAGVFVPATLGAIRIIRKDFTDMDGEIRRIFGASAGYVQPLTRGLTGLVRNALPGLRKGIESALPIVRAIERGLPRVGKAIGDLFADLSDDADEASMAVDYLFKLIEFGIQSISGTLQVLTQTFAWLDKISAYIGGNHERLAGYVNAQAEAEQGAGGFTAALQRLGATDPGTETLWQRQVLLNKSMSDGIAQAGGLQQALELLNGGALSAREAERAFQESIDAVTASIRANGQSLDATTEKGRANQTALDAVATAGQTRAQSIYEQTLATQGQVAAEAAAAKAYAQGREQLIRSAQQFGMTRARARAYADSVMAIPREWSTKVTLVGHKESVARAKEVENAVKRLTGKTIRIGVVGGRGGVLEGMSSGGRVGGFGIGDRQLRLLDAEEHVWTRAEVRAAGGHSAMEALRRSVVTGKATPATSRSYLANEAAPTRATTSTGGAPAPVSTGDTYVYVEIDGQQLEGRIISVVHQANRATARRVQAGAKR
jgi:hypothetical protein